MFKIAKSISTADEHFDYGISQITRGHYDDQKKKHIYHNQDELHIRVYGKIDEQEYCLHFIPSIPIEKYFDIVKYESLKLDEQSIEENYIMIDGIAYLDLKMELNILRFNETLVFTLMFRDCDDEFYGNAEVEIALSDLKKYLEDDK